MLVRSILVLFVVFLVCGCLSSSRNNGGGAGLSAEEHAVLAVADRVQKGDELTDRDWQDLVGRFERTNDAGVHATILATMAMLENPSPERRADMAGLAKRHLGRGLPQGNLSAVLVLQRVGDPAWREHAVRGMQSRDPMTRDLYRSRFGELLPP